jgi:hypothetical protein
MRLIRNVAFVWLAVAAIVVFGQTTTARASSRAFCDWSDCIGSPEGCYSMAVGSLGCVGECDQADDCFDAINWCEDFCDDATELLPEFDTCQEGQENPTVFICRCEYVGYCSSWPNGR